MDTREIAGGLEPAPNTPASIDEELRELLVAQHEENAEETTTEIDLPGHHGLLVVRYHRVPWGVTEQASKIIRRGKPGAVLNAMLDLMIAACEEVLARRKSGELVPISAVFPELGSGPVRYTRELAAAFNPKADFTEAKARACVLAMFPTEQSIAPHATELQRWLEFNEDEAEEDEAEEGFSTD